MKVLVTSGGTKIPIDTVRDITNMSAGTFGTKIAKAFMFAGHDVTFFHAKGSKTPFKFEWDFFKRGAMGGPYMDHIQFYQLYHDQYAEREFRNFEDYQDGLWKLIDAYNFDIVVLAAAVSDYGVTPVDGKIRSGSNMQISLYPLPKLISQIRERCPETCLVGFKFLVGSSDQQLRDAVMNSIHVNDCDLVVGNDLAHIKAKNHTLYLGSKRTGEIEIFNSFGNDLASIVVEKSLAERLCQNEGKS